MNESNTDIIISQKTRPEESLDFDLLESMDNFLLNSPLETEEVKHMIVVTNSEIKESVFVIPEHTNIFTIHIQKCWEDAETIKTLK